MLEDYREPVKESVSSEHPWNSNVGEDDAARKPSTLDIQLDIVHPSLLGFSVETGCGTRSAAPYVDAENPCEVSVDQAVLRPGIKH